MSRYFDELKRRNVFRVAAAYAVVGWLAIEVVDTLAPRMGMPDWVPGFVILLVLIGFPIALLFSWAFELTPEGIKKTADVDLDESIASTTAQKINYVIIAALAAVVLVQQFSPSLSKISPFSRTAGDAAPIAVAVLPFADLSADGDQEYLGDGVAEEILNVLAGVDGLKVTSRTSAFAFKGESRAIPEIATILGVSYVVEGSIRKQKNRVRITAQLIDVTDDSHLWSETYDSDLSDIFRLQDEIAAQISAALSRSLDLALPSVVPEERDWSVGAYELYLRARQLVVARSNYEEAIEMLDAAIKLEPEFADARAEKAAALALAAFGVGLSDETIDEAYAMYDQAWLSARQATELDPGHPLGLAVQGLVRMNQKRWIEARVFFDRALEAEQPSDYAFLWLGILQSMTGDTDGALATFKSGLDTSPTAPNLIRWRGRVLAHQEDWPAVWAQRSMPSSLSMQDTVWLQQLAGLHLGALTIEDVITWLEEQRSVPGHQQRSALLGGNPGPTIAAIESVFEPNESATDSSIEGIFLRQNIGTQITMIEVQPDLTSDFFDLRDEGILRAPNRNYLEFLWVPGAYRYRQSQRFTKLVTALKLPAYWDLFGWPNMCQPTTASEFTCD